MVGPPTFAAAAFAEGFTNRKPFIVRQDSDSITIRHAEPMFVVTGANGYTSDFRYINPGDASVFPWLASQARGWEKYTFHNLAFMSKSRCSSATAGSIVLAIDHDASDDLPVTSQLLASYSGASEDSPWKDVVTEADIKRIQPNLYIRRGPLPPNTDRKTYDCGIFIVGKEDGAVISWSRIWVAYEVTLSIPQVAPEGAEDVGAIVSTAGMSGTNPLGTTHVHSGLLSAATVFGQHVNIPVSTGTRYYISAQATGVNISVFGFGSIVGATVSRQVTSALGASGGAAAAEGVFTATAETIEFDLATVATSLTTSCLISSILPLNSGL